MSLTPNQGELLMALAEYLRNDPQGTFPLEHRKEIREVVGYQEDVEKRGGCRTCEYDVHTVVVYYETWGGELAHMEIERSFGELIAELESTVKDYGQYTQYSGLYGNNAG